MHPDKAPGPDGMGPGFYQQHWDIVGSHIVKLVTDFFDTGVFPQELNNTNLVLIPKKKNFSSMGDLWLIALCNVLYKIGSKVLANRMHNMIDLVISETQSAFILGRLISDNIMVAFDVMHYLKRKRRERWVNLIMACVTSVRYTIMHNNHVMGPIIPTRGIRQGCRVANGAPSISHMLFADDSYLFCQASSGAALNICTLLHFFEMASGQKVNVTKSSIFFSPITDSLLKNEICSTLGMPKADEHSLYLGLPNIIVIQSLPTYAMSVFLIPHKIYTEIETLMANFWWKTISSKGNGIIWMDHDIVHDMFNSRDASLILGLPLCFSAGEDCWPWIGESTVHFSIKSAYNLLQQSLVTKHVNISSSCPICKSEPESIPHALISCVFAQSCWQYAHPSLNNADNTTVGTLLYNNFLVTNIDTRCRISMLCWAIWKARNNLVWDKKPSTPQQVASLALV
ncbi:hypothetical protein CsatB_009632 [Cannabis sativa]